MFRPVRRALPISLASLTAVLLGLAAPGSATAAAHGRATAHSRATARERATACERAAARVFPRLVSEYVRMPDGVQLAVDVWLPPGTTPGARLPTVLETDRYWRAQAYTGGIKRNPQLLHSPALEPARLRLRVRRPARHRRLVRHADRGAGPWPAWPARPRPSRPAACRS